jgi:hypothetical protein
VKLAVEEARLYEWPFVLRLPFRFGVITVTHGRQAVVHLRIRLADGREGWGVAAESLAAKWFDKDPRWSDDDNLEQLRVALQIAVRRYQAGGLRTAFAHFADNYAGQVEEGATLGLGPLVANYGPALLDRAVLDALCRIEGISFYDAMRRNLPNIGAHEIAPDLRHENFECFLASLKPAQKIAARHTVGLVDPITASDQQGTRVGDGLPETLEEVVRSYGCTYYKLKVGGKIAADVERLEKIAAVLDTLPSYQASLDGNEQYEDAAGVVALWEAMERSPKLGRLRKSILFIEQPIKRAMALTENVASLAAKRPVIIDESDGTIDAFVRGRALGYEGISSKTCKGFYKSVLNLARCRRWNEQPRSERFFLSGEDLTTLAGVSVQQDLALVSLLGVTHVERNGHHFVDGFHGRPSHEADAFLAAHPDLYHQQHGHVRLRIEQGMLSIGSLGCAGFGVGVTPDFSSMEPMRESRWRAPPPA